MLLMLSREFFSCYLYIKNYLLPFCIIARRELTKLQEEQVVYIKKIDKEKQRKEQLEEGIEVGFLLPNSSPFGITLKYIFIWNLGSEAASPSNPGQDEEWKYCQRSRDHE